MADFTNGLQCQWAETAVTRTNPHSQARASHLQSSLVYTTKCLSKQAVAILQTVDFHSYRSHVLFQQLYLEVSRPRWFCNFSTRLLPPSLV